jgi:hypothetical protein
MIVRVTDYLDRDSNPSHPEYEARRLITTQYGCSESHVIGDIS